MVLHPEVQEKARAELDAVVGQDRLPSFEDRPYLPYLEAVAKECARWHTVAPTGGYNFVNARVMTHDLSS
jgi:cytochrome P450